MKSASVVTIGNRKVVAGLTWKALPGISSQSKEVAQYSSELGMRHGVVVSSDDSALIGLCHLSEKLPAGAAWVAAGSKGESIVLLEPVGETHCWVCAVRNGCPQPDFDIVLPIEDVPSALDRLASISNFKVATKHFDGADIDIDFESIIEGKKPVYVRQLVGTPKPVKIAIGAGISAFVLIYAWYTYSQEQSRLKAQADLDAYAAQSAIAEKQAAEAQRLAAIKALEESVRSTVTSAPSALDAVNSWLTVIEPLPMIASSWKIKSIDCSTVECKVVWSRHKTGTTNGFMSLAEANGWNVTSYGLNEITISLPVSMPARNGDPYAVPTAVVARPAMLTALQTLALIGIDGDAKDPVDPVPAGPAVSASGVAPAAPTNTPIAGFTSPWRVGAISISGKRFFELRGVPEYLNRDYISISSLKFSGESSNWSMEGKYAVK